MDRSERVSLLPALLSSSLAALFLNQAASLLAHPRAFQVPGRLGLPLAAGWAVLAAGWLLVVLPAVLIGGRHGLRRGALLAGLCTGFVLCAALAPMVEVALREASRERAAVVLGCAAGFVLCAGAFAHAVCVRGAVPAWLERVPRAAPLLGALALGAVWGLEYLDGAAALAIAAGGVAGAAGVAAWAGRLPRYVGPALAALVLALAGLDALSLGRSPAVRPGPAGGSALPPVVLITIDTLRADRVLGDGPGRVPTPGIDALAADSVVFTRARSAAPWTKPSLATLLTGLSPLVHGVTNRRARLPEGIETLAERLRAAGYHTGGVGLNVHLERAFGFAQGFDDYAFPARLEYGLALGARVLERLAPARFPEMYPSTTAIADVAVDWIAAHADEPFFLWTHVLDPHWPYEPPREWVEHPERQPRRWGDPQTVTAVQAGNTKPGAAERERVAELYAGEIRYVDSQVGRILAALRRYGLYERALIVLASDHGEEFWEHGHYEHGHTLYDEVLRVPLAFKLPGEGARLRVDGAVSTQSLVPTLLDALGIAFDPETLSSPSLAGFWRDPTATHEPGPLYAGGTYYYGEKHCVVFEDKKLVLELDTGRFELFDLAHDPRELHAVTAGDPEDTRRGLRLLEEWQERCGRLRDRLGIALDSSAEVGNELLERMRALGYVGAE